MRSDNRWTVCLEEKVSSKGQGWNSNACHIRLFTSSPDHVPIRLGSVRRPLTTLLHLRVGQGFVAETSTMASLINTVRSSTFFSHYNWIVSCQYWRVSCLEFLEAIRSVNPPGRWKILVVDEHSQQLLSSVLKQYDVLQENVTCMSLIKPYFILLYW